MCVSPARFASGRYPNSMPALSNKGRHDSGGRFDSLTDSPCLSMLVFEYMPTSADR